MARKSKGLSGESIKLPATLDNSLSPRLDCFNKPKFRVDFNGNCLQSGRAFDLNKIINLYTVFEKP